MPGANHLNEHEGLKSQILDYAAKGKYLAAICAAPIVFGNLGILNGRKAVCYPGFETQLTGAEVLTLPFVVDNHILSGRGVGAALQFSLEIVRIFKGEELALKLRQAMLLE